MLFSLFFNKLITLAVSFNYNILKKACRGNPISDFFWRNKVSVSGVKLRCSSAARRWRVVGVQIWGIMWARFVNSLWAILRESLQIEGVYAQVFLCVTPYLANCNIFESLSFVYEIYFAFNTVMSILIANVWYDSVTSVIFYC